MSGSQPEDRGPNPRGGSSQFRALLEKNAESPRSIRGFLRLVSNRRVAALVPNSPRIVYSA
jgi:hypothetical protein